MVNTAIVGCNGKMGCFVSQAVQSRDAIRGSQYNPKGDAWLLFKK